MCSQSVPASLLRPLRLPKVGAGQDCPTTASHHVLTEDFGGVALGTGPVETTRSGECQQTRPVAGRVVWIQDPLVRGTELFRSRAHQRSQD
jgi:hypothetical protein